MVLLHRPGQILLARSPHFPKGQYSALAGFVELGESAEQAAKREVKEEVGLDLTELSYFDTQPWPFPDRFMIAFSSAQPKGDLILDPKEIEDAKWFDIDDLPRLPSKASIAQQLIQHVIEQYC